MKVVETVIVEAAEAVGQEPDWLWEVQRAVLEGAHEIVVKAAALVLAGTPWVLCFYLSAMHCLISYNYNHCTSFNPKYILVHD